MLEIYYLKAGYIPGEQFALHARRRFRLIPAPGHPNPPQLDMSLFIVHYGPSEQNDRVPANMVPYDERVNAIMQQRHFLLRGGQIRRKEFMLSDRVNWPSLPELTRQQMGPQMGPRGVPQQMAYPPQPAPGPPAKRARHSQSQGQQQAIQGMPPLDAAFDDDEDISRGDMFDHLTPREISLSRYQQNHEWMEEILSSAYRIGQIQPSDLNLGLKGELASLTEGIFTAQGGDVFTQPPDKPYVGRLEAGLADEFRKRVGKHVESTEDEIKKLEEEHTELMASFKESSALKVKEKEIRSIPDPPAPEIFKSEERMDTGDEERKPTAQLEKTPFDDILKDVEAATGRKIDVHPAIKRVQDGGYQAPAPKPPTPVPTTTQMSRQPSQSGSQNSGLMIGDSDLDMGGTAAGLLDQMHTGFSSMSTPVNNFPTPQAQASAAQSNAPTPSNINNAPSPAAAVTAPAANIESTQPSDPEPAGDVDMTGTDVHTKETAGSAPDQGSGNDDWVVVPKGGASPEDNAPSSGPPPASDATATAPAGTGSGTGAATATTAAPVGTAEATSGESEQQKPASASTKPISAAATPAVTDGGSASFDQNDFSSLGDLDTAGDALAGYDAPDLDGDAGGLGEDLDLQMDMEDSAFGDAFHGVDSSGTPGDAQNQDM